MLGFSPDNDLFDVTNTSFAMNYRHMCLVRLLMLVPMISGQVFTHFVNKTDERQVLVAVVFLLGEFETGYRSF
jgi:hypothetical protein